MTRAAWMALALLLFLPAPGSAQQVNPAAGLEKHDGFIPFYWNQRTGHLLFALSPERLRQQFLYFSGLGTGIGTLQMFADRGTVGASAVCHFERVGPRVLVVAENERFRALNGDEALRDSVTASFPTAVLAALPVVGDAGGDLLVDANPLLIRDAFGLLRQLAVSQRVRNGQIVTSGGASADWRLDPQRSAVAIDHVQAFPLNTETAAILTFTSDRPSADALAHMADGNALTVREHQSFVALPPPGYQTRESDPRVGYFGETFEDFSQPYDEPLIRHFIERWRLAKQTPGDALSAPVKPLVFYLDPAIPEPMRSAIRRGALWWNAAFEQAGFKDAIEIADLPAGADPLDFRYPTIQWTNRSGRGWSVGQAQADPRTGEILHAVVQLDSFRMRTVHNYWDALTQGPPQAMGDAAAFSLFAPLDGLDPRISQQRLMLNRLALLACHEMGHVLGLQHNFIASTYDRGSVMDYYAPRITIRPDGTPDLSDAYMQGVGSYDKFAIDWGYSTGPTGATATEETARLNTLVESARHRGVVWGSAADPRWNAYDDGPDPVTWLREVAPVRDALLRRYGAAMLRPGEPDSDLTGRFALIYLFHQYGLEAALNTIGGAVIPPALAGDGQTPVQPWSDSSARQALALELAALASKELAIPVSLWRWLGPPHATDPIMGAERFQSSAGYLFSPYDAARAVAEIVVGGLLNPQRLARVAVLHEENASALSVQEILGQLVNTTFFPAPAAAAGSDRASVLAGVVQTEVGERLMDLAVDPTAPPEVQAAAWRAVDELARLVHTRAASSAELERLDEEFTLFTKDPLHNAPRVRGSGAPPGPPV